MMSSPRVAIAAEAPPTRPRGGERSGGATETADRDTDEKADDRHEDNGDRAGQEKVEFETGKPQRQVGKKDGLLSHRYGEDTGDMRRQAHEGRVTEAQDPGIAREGAEGQHGNGQHEVVRHRSLESRTRRLPHQKGHRSDGNQHEQAAGKGRPRRETGPHVNVFTRVTMNCPPAWTGDIVRPRQARQAALTGLVRVATVAAGT